jgi:sugar phosphate isomerase/epimerase
MIRSAVTISLVEEARGGPFVFWDSLEDSFQSAQQIGFDAVEIFAPGPDAIEPNRIRELCDKHKLLVAAVGTGAGMVKHALSLTDPDESKRRRAVEFVKGMIRFGSHFQAPAIIGSMQGRWSAQVSYDQAIGYLSDALMELGDYALQHSVELFYEPLNRYETNLVKNLADGCQLLRRVGKPNVKLLADLFHLNIEEANIASAIIAAGKDIGHVHFVDSNRQAAGLGHIDYRPIIEALRTIHYNGYLSAEALPIPDSTTAARATIQAFKAWVG